MCWCFNPQNHTIVSRRHNGMVTIHIGDSERSLSEADASWINQQINRRRSDNLPVCVRVMVVTDELNMVLTTPTCGGSHGGGRAPYRREQEVFELWERRGMNQPDFTGGVLIAFLRQDRKSTRL